jgi:WD40 repeat protein
MSKNHSNYIYCITILNNKRLVSGGYDSKIIVYDKNYTHPELEINEHGAAVTSLIVSSNGNLISSSCDKTLKIFKIEENSDKTRIFLNYFVLQTINTTHTNNIIHVRELSTKRLVSCSLDTQLNFYSPQNNNYSLESTIDVSKSVYNILEVPNYQLCVAFADELKLFDLSKRKFIKELKDIGSYTDWVNDNLCLLKQNYLSICGNNYIYIVDLVQFKLINKVETKSNNICLCYWDNKLIIGTNNGMIQEYKVNDMNLSKISFKEKCHQNHIWQILKDEEGNIISCSHDNYIKVWNKII